MPPVLCSTYQSNKSRTPLVIVKHVTFNTQEYLYISHHSPCTRVEDYKDRHRLEYDEPIYLAYSQDHYIIILEVTAIQVGSTLTIHFDMNPEISIIT